MRFFALACLAALAVAGSAAAAEAFTVRLDHSARITLSRPARDVVVGNPAVADVNMLDARNLVISGKGYGVTNLLVVDLAGKTILDRDVVVVAGETGAVSFFRGGEVRTFACAARCERTGDIGSTPATTPQAAPPTP